MYNNDNIDPAKAYLVYDNKEGCYNAILNSLHLKLTQTPERFEIIESGSDIDMLQKCIDLNNQES